MKRGLIIGSGEKARQIAGVGSCTFVSNILGVDTADEAVTPVYTYADTRPADVVGWLRERLDEEAIHQRTGCVFHSSYLPARFLWIAHSHPDLLDTDVRWTFVGEYLVLKLFGTIFQLMKPLLLQEPVSIASGGALTGSSLWSQILADVLGRTVTVSQVREASARGAAMLALRSLGIVPDLSVFPAFTGQAFQPDPKRHARYQAAMQRQ